jgi:hypothetical protein
VKLPEIVIDKGRVGLKFYLCQTCATKLRALKNGDQLHEIDLRMLCEECLSQLGGPLPS